MIETETAPPRRRKPDLRTVRARARRRCQADGCWREWAAVRTQNGRAPWLLCCGHWLRARYPEAAATETAAA